MRGWPVFFHAPHRVMFMAGATQGLLAMLWWAFDLGARYGMLFPAPAWPLAPSWLHGVVMIYGFFPFFIFGFLMTAGPRWVGARPVAEAAYRAAFALMAAGWLGFYAALLGLPRLAAPALGLVLAGWCVGLAALARVARQPAAGRSHIRIAVAALGCGALGLAAFVGLAAGGPAWLKEAALAGGLWFFLLPVFVTVCHRMIPFFSSVVIPRYRVVQPLWALHLLVACFAGHGVLALAGATGWTWLFDAPAALLALGLTVAWQIRRSFAVRLLAVLHVPFAWLGVALALHAVQSLLFLGGIGALGLAPLHALTLGFFASIVIGMVTRVTLGHSGRELGADGLVWGVFWAVQAVAVVRIAAEFLALPGPANLSLLAAVGWLLAFGRWYARHAPAYLKPRPDGRPG